MSTELETIEENGTSPELSMTSFFGGTERGRCIQITQSHRNPNDGFPSHGIPVQHVAINQAQARQMIEVLSEWLGEPSFEERVRDVVEQVLEEKANEPLDINAFNQRNNR